MVLAGSGLSGALPGLRGVNDSRITLLGERGCSGGGASQPHGRVERALRQVGNSFCGNCLLERAIKNGSVTPKEAINTLDRWSSLRRSPRRGRRVARLSTGANKYLYYDIDSWGADSCNDTRAAQIEAAIDFILANLSDITTTCTANDGSAPCRRDRTTSCFSGHAPTTNPRSLVQMTLSDSDIDFKINCNDPADCETGAQLAYTRCNQWRQGQQDIHICKTYLDTDPDPDALACVIVHEIFHVWGADETAAWAMQPTGSWSCP